MSRKRKVYSASFRAQVALTAARGDKTVNEIAAQFEVSPQMVLKMKARLKDRIEDIFQDERARRKKPDGEATQEELFEQIGRLKMEVDWLKKKSAQFD
jgi:transposase